MENLKEAPADFVQKLVDLGKSKGFITYEDLNNFLPAEVTSSEELDDVLGVFDSLGIHVVESAEDLDKVKQKQAAEPEDVPEEAEVEKTATESDEAVPKSSDPVRMYLRKMGAVALLTREGEVEIAKRIEKWEEMILTTILKSEIGLNEILKIGEAISKGEMKVTEVIKEVVNIDANANTEGDALEEKPEID